MRASFGFTCMIGAVLLTLSVVPVAAHAQSTDLCDRSCLDRTMDQMLASMVANDPSKAPLAMNVHFTENTIQLKPGEGLWGTMTGLTGYRIQIADPQTGNAGFMGRIYEHGVPRYFAARIKVAHHKITEIETVVSRGIPEPMDVKVPTARPGFSLPLPPADRSSRAAMVAALNGYANSIVGGDGKLAPFSPECARIENGLHTTSNSGLLPPTPKGLDIAGMGCSDQMSTEIFKNTTSIDRRIWVVDQERGVVMGELMFNSDGRDMKRVLSDGEPNPFGVPVPGSGPIAESFHVVDGKIHEIEAVFGAGGYYGMKSGW